MAVTNSIALGKSRGSIGNVTLSSWKGLSVAKQKPSSVAQPPSDKRTMQQSAMAQIVALYRLLTSVIDLGFKSLAIQMSAYNAFSSLNLKSAFDLSAPPIADLLYANLKFSKGTIADTAITTVVADESFHTCVFTFPTTYVGSGQSASDVAVIVVIDAISKEVVSSITSASRSTGTASVVIPATWVEGNLLHCYLSFSALDGKSVSDTVYSDTTVVA